MIFIASTSICSGHLIVTINPYSFSSYWINPQNFFRRIGTWQFSNNVELTPNSYIFLALNGANFILISKLK